MAGVRALRSQDKPPQRQQGGDRFPLWIPRYTPLGPLDWDDDTPTVAFLFPQTTAGDAQGPIPEG